MYGCESWTTKKAEYWRTDAFELWCWQRLLWVLWTAWKSNQSIPEEINLDYSLEGLVPMLKFNTLATWCAEPTHWKRPWFWERWRAWGEGEDRGWDGRMASLTRWTWVWVNSGNWWWTGRPGGHSPWGHKESDTTEWLNWTEPRKYSFTDYAEFPNTGISYNIKKSYSINLTTNLIKKKVWQIQVFQNSNFCLKTWILSPAMMTAHSVQFQDVH